ncbi:MAG TPA: NAD(P) transhydrogenase subunit alpha, partial [Saprospiraceae bacterium]|nr:NAD(P) transhydrogenase subunit alpha [Saprospiraceae bacterium]
MSLLIGVLKEREDKRVAITPDNIKRSKIKEAQWWIERDAGDEAGFPVSAYEGLAQSKTREEILTQADILLSVFPPAQEDYARIKPGALLISQFRPYQDGIVEQQLANYPFRAISMDMIPRTTLAQAMDVLSSMASISGYRAVIMAALNLPRYFPMMITSAGSIKPAKVLVIGAGVAGLQAIATARKLGAIVEAFDVRSAAKEEVQSLGAKFVEVEGAKDDKGAGGYAVQQSEEFLTRQRAEVQARATKADVIICTAQVRGRKAPVLIEADTIPKMRHGSVIVDLAASSGGNCALTENDKTVIKNGVTIIGNSGLEMDMPEDASQMFGNNILNLLAHITKDGQLNLNMEDEIVKGALIKA